MRRIFIVFCALVMTIAVALSGCSCNTTSPLSFNTNFYGEGANATDLPQTYKEVCTYDVSYNANYNSALKMDSSLVDKVNVNYSGTYVTEFQGDTLKVPDSIVTDLHYEGDIHYFTTKLELDVTVNDKVYHDQIFSEVYFYSAGQAFQPIYSKVIQKNTFIGVSIEPFSVNAQQQIYQYETTYNKNEFVTLNQSYNANSDEVASIDIYSLDKSKFVLMKDTITSEYVSKQAIDNASLLFAIRNITLKEEASYTLPTTSPSYSEPKSLTVKNVSESTYNLLAISYNGQALENVNLPVKNLTFVIGGTKNVGTQQNVVVQKAKSETFPYFNSLLIEYAESLSEITSFSHLGALVYKLNAVAISGLN